MIKKITIILLLCSFSYLNAQDTTATQLNWKHGGLAGLNFSNVGLSNWAGGGSDMISITGVTNLFAVYKTDNMTWDNTLDLGYGVVKQGSEDLRKSDDRLIFLSKLGYNATSKLLYTALLDFRTQFDLGYDYSKADPNTGSALLISDFMSPAYLNLGLGMNYRPDDYWQFFLSAISNRLIIVLNEELSNQGAYGVNPGEKVFSQLGASANIIFQKDIFDNVNFRSRLNLFSAYNRFTSVVVTSETALNMKVNSFINASFNLDVIYDDKVSILRNDGTRGPSTQIRHVIGIGIAYKFGHDRETK
ncbi:MAG: DUF3078 domain-containing protein [Candidatus Kapabacteria bacterium]|nr:DUF3078 domain-containing protein [Ignavibacteriota bacterium]MCW5884291.1 DUF3078 domain-containing protein [Candidatus Kapabacteria bacterium]